MGHPTIAAAAAGSTAPAETPSAWLKQARGHWIRGEFRASGQAYERALASMAPRKQVADEGAQAVLLAIDAYWSSFEQLGEIADLDYGIAAATRWLELAGPRSAAQMYADVQRGVARLQSVSEPFHRAQSAANEASWLNAARGFEGAAEALRAQARAWPSVARMIREAAQARYMAFDADHQNVPWVELETAETAVDVALAERPDTDRSEVGAELLALRQRLAELREIVERERAAVVPTLEAPPPAPPAPPVGAEPSPLLPAVVGYVLLPAGVTAVAGGAALLGLGIAVSRRAPDTADALLVDSRSQTLDPQQRMAFEDAVEEYRQDSRRYAYATIISGSALVAGGVAMTVVGAVVLHQHRRSASDRARWTTGPMWSGRERQPIGWMFRTEF